MGKDSLLIKDILTLSHLGLNVPTPLTIRGRLFKRHVSRRRVFLQVADPSGNIQAVIDRDNPDGLYAGACETLIGSRVECVGTLDIANFRKRNSDAAIPSVLLSEIRSHQSGVDGGNKYDDLDHFVMQAIYLARLRKAVSSAYEQDGYIEMEPRLITLTAPVSGLEPLQVSYVGFGAPAHLYPSPARQLREIITNSDLGAVFAISRIFSTNYRDEVTSNEAVTAMGMRVLSEQPDYNSETPQILKILNLVAQEPWLRPAKDALLFDLAAVPRTLNMLGQPRPLGDTEIVEELTLESYGSMRATPNVSGAKILSFLRVIAPRRSIIAEQSIIEWYGKSVVEVTTLHLERLVGLLPKLTLRALYDFKVGEQIKMNNTQTGERSDVAPSLNLRELP